jgi:hypothetical protein
MKRRAFITLLGGAAAAWPLAARAQQVERRRRVGVLMGFDENDPGAKGWLSGFMRGLAELGWSGRNVRIDVRWAAGDLDRMQKFAKELVDLESEVILTQLTPVTAARPATAARHPRRRHGHLHEETSAVRTRATVRMKETNRFPDHPVDTSRRPRSTAVARQYQGTT